MSDNSKMVPDRAIFTTVDQWKVIYGLLNGAIFNDLEWPQTQFLRPHYSLMLSLKQYCLKLSCNYNNPAYAAVFNSNFHSVFERKPITYYYYQLPPLAIRVSGDLQAVGFKKSDVITSSIPTTPPWLLTRPAVNVTLHCSDKSSTPEIFKHRFYELCHELRITITYLLMALKKVTELQLLWSIETILSVFDYLILQASSELNCMPFCLR